MLRRHSTLAQWQPWKSRRTVPLGPTKKHHRFLSNGSSSNGSGGGSRSARRGLGSTVFKVFKYTYGGLAMIPTGFTIASVASAIGLQDKPRARAFAFWAWTGWLSLPLSIVLLALAPFSLLADPVDRWHLDFIQRIWARWTVWPFFEIETQGVAQAKAFLKERGHGCVVVSNHRSMMDVFVLFAALDIPLRFVSKQEIFFIPLVGWVMGLIGHVALIRGDKQSGKSVLENCKYYLQNGREWSVVFFAEGSRSRALDERQLGEFKIGAFKLAQSTKAACLPISISGTAVLMPPGEEFATLREGVKVSVLVHKAIRAEDDTDAELLRSNCFAAIYEGLVDLNSFSKAQ